MSNNPFLNSLKTRWSELTHISYSNFIELISKAIALLIVIAILTILTPTIGIVLSVYHTINRMVKETYEKQKNTADDLARFPIIIELAVYFLIWLPLCLILIPYWALSKTILFCANHFIVTFIIAVIMAVILLCMYIFKFNFIEFIKNLGLNI